MAEWLTPTAVHSSCGASQPNANAIDDSTSTAWSHSATAAHWIIFDLGTSYALTKIQVYTGLYPFGAATGAYVYVSDDPDTWGDAVWDGLLNAAGWNESGAFSKSGRYVKLLSKVTTTQQWIYEFDAEVPSPPREECTHTAKGWVKGGDHGKNWDVWNAVIRHDVYTGTHLFDYFHHNGVRFGTAHYLMYYKPTEQKIHMMKATANPALLWSDVGASAAGTGGLLGIDCVVDSAGIIHVIALDSDGSKGCVYTTFNTTTDTWGSWEVVDAGATTSICGVSIYVDQSDYPHAVYVISDVITYRERTGGSWSAATSVSTGGTYNRWPSILINVNDLIMVAWVNKDAGDYDVLSRKNSGSWGTVKTAFTAIATDSLKVWYPELKLEVGDAVALILASKYLSDSTFEIKHASWSNAINVWIPINLPASYTGSYEFRMYTVDFAHYLQGSVTRTFILWRYDTHNGVLATQDMDGNWSDPPTKIPNMYWGYGPKRLMKPLLFSGINEPAQTRLEFGFWLEGYEPGSDNLAFMSRSEFPPFVKTAVTATANAAALIPTITAGGLNTEITAVTATANAIAPVATVAATKTATVLATVAEAAAIAQIPVVSAIKNAVVTGVLALAACAALVAAIVTGATITAPVSQADAATPVPIVEGSGAPQECDDQVDALSDDAEEQEINGHVGIDVGGMEIASGLLAERWWSAVRLNNGPFPAQGSTITAAYVELYTYGSPFWDNLNADIYCEQEASPATFAAEDYNITSRVRGEVSAAWVANDLPDGWNQSPTLVDIFQELVDAYTPTSIVLIFKPRDDVSKMIFFYDWETEETHLFGAKLHLEWTEPGGNASVSAVAAQTTAVAPIPTITTVKAVTVLATVATADASASLASVSIGGAILTQPATASATVLVPTILAIRNVAVTALIAEASTEAYLSAISTASNVVVQATIVEADAGVPQPTVSTTRAASVTAITVQATGEAPIPIVSVGVSPVVSAVVATATAGALQPVIATTRTVNVLTVVAEANAMVPLPTVTIGEAIVATVAGATAEALIPTIVAIRNTAIIAVIAGATAAAPAPAIAVGGSATIPATTIQATASILTPIVSTVRNTIVTATGAEATTTAPIPIILTGGSVEVAALVAQANAEAPSPTIAAIRTATITATVAGASASAPVPSVQVAIIALATPAQAGAGALVPVIATVRNTTITAVLTQASASAPMPAILTGGSIAVPATTAVANAAAPTPTVATVRIATTAATIALAGAAALTPTIATTSTATILAVIAAANAAAIAPTLAGAATVPGAIAQANAIAPIPIVIAVLPTTVAAVEAEATATAPIPTVIVAADVSALTATATAEALPGTITTIRIVTVLALVAQATAAIPTPSYTGTALVVIEIEGRRDNIITLEGRA